MISMRPARGTMLDNDMHRRLLLQPHQANEIFRQLCLDAMFLMSHNIMDYSLLIGVHHCREQQHPTQHCGGRRVLEPNRNRSTQARAIELEGPGVFYFALIDCLQAWNWGKRIESMFKSKVMLLDPVGISAVPPLVYCERFISMLCWRLKICPLDLAASAGAPYIEGVQVTLDGHRRSDDTGDEYLVSVEIDASLAVSRSSFYESYPSLFNDQGIPALPVATPVCISTWESRSTIEHYPFGQSMIRSYHSEISSSPSRLSSSTSLANLASSSPVGNLREKLLPSSSDPSDLA